MSLPNLFQQFLDHDAGVELVKCKACTSIPERCEAVDIGGCDSFILLNCTSSGCKRGTWFICCACNQSFPRWGKAEKHVTTTKHQNKIKQKEDKSRNPTESLPPTLHANTSSPTGATNNNYLPAFGSGAKFFPLAGESQGSFASLLGNDTVNDGNFEGDESDGYVSVHPADLFSSPCKEGNTNLMDETVPPPDAPAPVLGVQVDSGHAWRKALDGAPLATPTEIFTSLNCSPNMQRFWQAEHNAPGGGLVYLVGRAFHRTTFLSANLLPDYQEAEWHMQNFMHYVGMSEKQRQWHAEITTKITGLGSDLIQRTRIPNAQELKRFYKSDSEHCIWSALPTPPIENIGGIAYVNPLNIVRFAFACGLQFDDIMLSSNTTDTGKNPGKQYYVEHCKKLQNLMTQLKAAQDGQEEYNIALCWCTDWRDGFSVNRTKNNRKSVVAWTFSVSPAKEAVNSVDNTFAMALGQKKNPNWAQVEHKVRADTSIFGDPKKPLVVYHGGLKKMVRVFVSRINTSHDKPERADITGTLNFNGNTHRSFGRLIQIVPPQCNSKLVRQFLEDAKPHTDNPVVNSLEWGWSNSMLEENGSNPRVNGAVLPSCIFCRAKNLRHLLGFFPGREDNLSVEDIAKNFGTCNSCADWTMDSTTASKLPFKAPEGYPTRCAPNCPVEPPVGRCTTSASLQCVTSEDTGKNEQFLFLVELQFPNLVKAMKFAFFNLVSKNPWTQKTAKAYLTANGISPKFALELIDVAKQAKEDGIAPTVDYKDPEGIHTFRFPAAWIDQNLEIPDYIETLMHELFLGVAEANFELCSIWNKARGRDTAFKRNAQDLLLELKKFGLNWLHTYQFSAKDDPKKAGGNYGTGSWQGENWIAWVRISKIVYLHASTKLTERNPQTTGNGDVFRMVIAFTALTARAMSHSGIDESDIKEFHNYLKEFFSCVRELDIQTRHSEMSKRTKKVVELNKTVPESGTAVVPIATLPAGNNTGKNHDNGPAGAGEAISPANNRPSATGKLAGSRKNMASSAATTNKRKRKKKSNDSSDEDPDYVEKKPRATKKSTPKTSSNTNKETSSSQSKRKKPSAAKASKKAKAASQEKGGPKAEWTGGGEAFWMRSNYLSLPNLIHMMEIFGLLINFWDGGGKGEKFVQEVKPLITRGVHDYDSFFVIVMEKLYKHRLLGIFRKMFRLFVPDSAVTHNTPKFGIGPDGEIQEQADLVDDQDYSMMEDLHMSKLKTFYYYRSKQQLESALEEKKPISGILVPRSDDLPNLDFYVLWTQKKSFHWQKMVFDDAEGTNACGLWYAPMEAAPPTKVIPGDFKAIQSLAKMSTVAIPMSYAIGANQPNSNKFCVITNWWKERQSNGRYSQPGLDPSCYLRSDGYVGIMERFANNAAV